MPVASLCGRRPPPTLVRCRFPGASSGACPLAGGFRTVPLPDEEATQLAQQALQSYLQPGAAPPQLAGCEADAGDATATVLEACYQVVAGKRWYITFRADIPCANGAASRHPAVQAEVVVPLPYLNAPPNITITG